MTASADRRRARSVLRFAGLALWLPLAALAAAASAGPEPLRRQETASPAAVYFTDTELIDQDGRQVRFYTDLLQGKVVVINTIFTSCTGICPVMGKTFARLQDHLGGKLGDRVRLISISVDPENDTPQKLKDFAAKFGGRPGWRLLTGKAENVRFILGKLGQAADVREDHKALLLIGNEPTGLWKKAFALAAPEEIIAVVDSVIEDKEGVAQTK